jgi:hypothetical protein
MMAVAPAGRDDIGESSSAEIARLQARVVELESEKRRLEIRITGLESEIDEAKAAAQKVVEHNLPRQIEELIDEHGVSIEDFLTDAIIQYAMELAADLGEKYAETGVTTSAADEEEEEERWFLTCAVAVLDALKPDEDEQSASEAPPSADDGLDIPPSLRRA